MTKALPVPKTAPPGSPTARRRFARLRSKVGHAAAGLQRANRLGQTDKAAAYRSQVLRARAALRRQKAAMTRGEAA